MRANALVRFSAVLLVLLGLLTSYWCGSSLLGIQTRIDVAQQLQANNDAVCNTLLNAETGQRGFLLTGNETYLDPYHSAKSGLGSLIEIYDTLPLDTAQARFRDAVEPVIGTKMDELARTITLRRTDGFSAALEVVKSDAGANLMQVLRNAFRSERERAGTAMTDLRHSVSRMVRGVLAGLALAVLGLLLFWIRARPRPVRVPVARAGLSGL